MSPLKIAIASLLVGLIGLTASSMENPGSSSIENLRSSSMENLGSSSATPRATGPRPLTEGLTIRKVRKHLRKKEMQVYSRRLQNLASCEAGYRYRHPDGSKRGCPLASPEHYKREIKATEREVLERMQNQPSEQGESEEEEPEVTPPQPLTPRLTMENVEKVLRDHHLAVYKKRLNQLASCEAGYRYQHKDGRTRRRPLSEPNYLRKKIYETEMRILNGMREGRSEQGEAQAEQQYVAQAEGEELDWEQLEQLNWEQLGQLYGAQAEGDELDVAEAEQGGAQAEGEELDWEQLEQLNWEQLGQIVGAQAEGEELDVGPAEQLDVAEAEQGGAHAEQLVGAQAEQGGAHAEQLDDEQAETARQIYADYGDDKPIHSNPTSPGGSSGVTSGYRQFLP